MANKVAKFELGDKIKIIRLTKEGDDLTRYHSDLRRNRIIGLTGVVIFVFDSTNSPNYNVKVSEEDTGTFVFEDEIELVQTPECLTMERWLTK